MRRLEQYIQWAHTIYLQLLPS
ncbi:hypothetical protein Ahy_B09g097275 isoform G [Arachis hypogaea]|uniref:Uncharacterized protein n=1 Tax=Arachis hypogaea TaxID=3818 RepID=A0A444XNU7_ARAHY|nr:hypothetical protein Ahy_B09g097275 isoform G [Arachis hypogaea]